MAALLAMLHRPLNGLVDTGALRIIADWLCRHPLVEPNNERVHRDANRDYTETPCANVCQTETQNEGVREHQQAISDSVDLGSWEVDVLQRRLNTEAEYEEPRRRGMTPAKLREAPARDDDDQGRRDQGGKQ